MNWDAISALSEASGVILIVASLIFVGFQIRQSALATKASTMSEIMFKWTDVLLIMSEDKNFAEACWSGIHDPDSISDVDKWRFSNMCSAIFRGAQNAHFQWTIGAYSTKA